MFKRFMKWVFEEEIADMHMVADGVLRRDQEVTLAVMRAAELATARANTEAMRIERLFQIKVDHPVDATGMIESYNDIDDRISDHSIQINAIETAMEINGKATTQAMKNLLTVVTELQNRMNAQAEQIKLLESIRHQMIVGVNPSIMAEVSKFTDKVTVLEQSVIRSGDTVKLADGDPFTYTITKTVG